MSRDPSFDYVCNHRDALAEKNKILTKQYGELRYILMAMAAEYLVGKDWHKLTLDQRILHHKLVNIGILHPSKSGFVGNVILTAEGQNKTKISENKSEWIECKRQPPPIDKQVLAFGPKFDNLKGGVTMDICVWDGVAWWNEGGTEQLWGDEQYTYWMPLPKTP